MKQLILFISVLMMISCSSTKESSQETTFENIYQSTIGGNKQFGHEIIQSNEDYLKLIEKLKLEDVENENLFDVDFEEKSVIVIYLGERNTGGYSIEVDSLLWNNNLLTIKTKQTKPQKGAMVTMAFTYPYCLSTIPKINLKENKIEIK